MSGIAGIVRFDGAPVEPGLVERMTAAMAHRGPDGIRHWSGGSVALGQCMLRATPESLDERQPLANEDGSFVLVMDGRVDNADELRRELLGRGAVLRDRTDAELVLRAYEAWGDECPPHVDGDFAFVVWDARRRAAFCVRDRFGQKPFHYHWDGTTLVFASDVHAILELPWVPQVLNEGMVAEFLGYEWISLDETFWDGVLRLPQAHRMTVDARGPRLARYWEPDLEARLPCRTDEEYAEHYRTLLFDAVRRMSRTIGPLACEVSGGLDSSALLSVAEHLRRDGKLLAPSLDAYTLAFTDDSAANELEYARAVGEHLGIPVHEIEPAHKPLEWYRDRAKRLRTLPSYPNGVMGLTIRESASRRGSRALIVGVGGDEWLAGSRCHYADAIGAGNWRVVAEALLTDRRELGARQAIWGLLRTGCLPLLPSAVLRPVRQLRARRRETQADRDSWLSPAMMRELRRRRRGVPTDRGGRAGTFAQDRQMRTLASPFLAQARDLEEAMAAEARIELRRPYFKRTLVEFAFATPEWLRVRGRSDKRLHRVAMRGYLPERVRARETKAEFVITYLRHLPELDAEISASIAPTRIEWIRPDAIAALRDAIGDHSRRDSPEWNLWTLFGCDALTKAGGV